MPIPLSEQNIINILGIEALPDERKAAIVEKVAELVQKRLVLRILESLSSDEREKFTSLLDAENQTEINRFLNEKVPDFASLLEEEVVKIKKEFSDFVSGLT